MSKPEEVSKVWCKECKKYIITEWEDKGIGLNEFRGALGNHREWIEVCPQCGEDADHDASPCDECKLEECENCQN